MPLQTSRVRVSCPLLLLHYVRGAIIHQEIIMAKTCVTLADLELDLYCNVNTRVRTLEEGAYDIATEVSGV